MVSVDVWIAATGKPVSCDKRKRSWSAAACVCAMSSRPCARKFGSRTIHLAIQTGLYTLRHNILKFLRGLLLLSLNRQ